MDNEQAKLKILELFNETEKLIPKDNVPNLDPIDGFPDISQWHSFENDIWKKGETIRQLLKEHKTLSHDKNIIENILSICLNRNAKRGRQSFIMLLWSKNYAEYADKLVSQIDDKFVYGHIIEGLNKMKSPYYLKQVRPFCSDKTTWIRKQAKKYIDQHDK
ncbi:hypothetical protein J0A68_12680 [Algoriphagus sp. H41]|uniref:DNA alkylation repair enzyme n=1 Tax=Algoriphagus oliviformis TaxID=2811231 RepID=A0ABS3C3W1_9BACT|nr:hypothetical protein [Algoriphagus oliviformis]MBN7811805.1 hypothetical protein [Algoriphagus oliviformis]